MNGVLSSTLLTQNSYYYLTGIVGLKHLMYKGMDKYILILIISALYECLSLSKSKSSTDALLLPRTLCYHTRPRPSPTQMLSPKLNTNLSQSDAQHKSYIIKTPHATTRHSNPARKSQSVRCLTQIPVIQMPLVFTYNY